MQFQVAINNRGHYVVAAYWQDAGGMCHWCSMRSFGEHEGSAIEFKNQDCPNFTEGEIKAYIRTYNPDKTYIRKGFKNYKVER